MNTKTFAQNARKNLLQGVAKKLLIWGFDKKGNVLEEPHSIPGGYLLRGEPYDDPNVPKLWAALKSAIAAKGIEVVVEEAAYTWFNRMMAIRIMAKNGYEEAQLSYADGMEHTPLILQRARQGYYPFLTSKEKTRLQKIIGDYNKDLEAFALLLTSYCHSHNTLKRVFGKLDDYTELLLPDNMLQDRGFLHLLNTTDAISDADYQSVELIGWLYQFYISEKKDEVFASFKKNKKAEAKDIPAATQIFTPNWIVKYMVENTAGKIWLDKNPDSPLRGKMKYLVENSSPSQGEVSRPSGTEGLISDVEELTLIDPACGSGHILVEGFDLLYQMYMEEYYTPEEAVESILKNNLFGLDIDERAAQLATFAILLKAAKVYSDVWTKDWLPQVYVMPEAHNFGQQELKDFLGKEGEDYLEELDHALRLMKQAKNLGSVMKLKLSKEAQTYIAQRFEELKNADYRDFNVEAVYQSIQSYIPVMLLLTKKYSSVVANPPYLGYKFLNGQLKQYVENQYPNTKSDLFAVFQEVLGEIGSKNSRRGIINQWAWMCIDSYKNFRERFINNYHIDSLLHLGIGVFKELNTKKVQNVALVFTNRIKIEGLTKCYKLDETFDVVEKKRLFSKREKEISKNLKTLQTIPGTPLAFWFKNDFIKLYETEPTLDDVITPRQGLATGNNAQFVRNWYEVSLSNIMQFAYDKIEAQQSKKKWFPYNKGGGYNKWFGNNYFILNWYQDGQDIKATKPKSVIRNEAYYFREGVSWSLISLNFSARYTDRGYLFDVGGSSGFPEKEDLLYSIALLNSKVSSFVLAGLNFTLNVQVGDIKRILFVKPEEDKKKLIEVLSSKLIGLSKKDFDASEMSREFKSHFLLSFKEKSIQSAYQACVTQVSADTNEFYIAEKENNSAFIELYKLNGQLEPEPDLKYLTIYQDYISEIKYSNDKIQLSINQDYLISSFINYSIGLFMGRYRLDKPGLNIAHPNPTIEELASYTYNCGEVIIDGDAILPLMGSNCNFPDDALHQMYGLLDTLWGHDTRTENINFIQECLDKDLEKFLVKDFYKYHCSMYKKKPIYWLFSSKKGAFQALVYMHRMNEFTAEKIRANYLLEHLKNLRSEEAMLSANESNLNTQEARKLEQIRKDIHECEEYDMELKNVADQQIKFDLDDGVTANYELFKTVVADIK
ncbi:BREX-1 system adenine-specific DNA-methyltransferase PglX [Namhaeicola litoreus]|uniref:site-specific DNA-methyltransferase (adenine-specific) n=1 Tax=Namhaeicola litoreus TaxID=1052145 RepID=A0ABW3Y2X2_9FLAO